MGLFYDDFAKIMLIFKKMERRTERKGKGKEALFCETADLANVIQSKKNGK